MQKQGQSQQDLTVYLDNLVCVVQEAFLVLDEDFRVVDASPTFYNDFYLDRDSAQGKVIYDLHNGSWDIPAMHTLIETELQQEAMVYDYEVRHQFDERGERMLRINGCRFGYVQGYGQTYILILRDTTSNYQEKQQLREDIEELQDQNQALDDFAHSVAHDLKNPVSSMMGFASLIKRYVGRMSEEDIVENVDSILESGEHIRDIIDSTLMLAMLDRNEKVHLEPLDMVSIIERVEGSLKQRIRESQTRIQLPDTWMPAFGYAPWVELVWMNYISNGIKYGGFPPELVLGSRRYDDRHSLFYVKDNGDGLTSAQQNIVFDSFTRVHINSNGNGNAHANGNGSQHSLDDHRDKIDGHGLGLALARKIMNKLDGDVYLESAVGKGSTFGFILPTA